MLFGKFAAQSGVFIAVLTVHAYVTGIGPDAHRDGNTGFACTLGVLELMIEWNEFVFGRAEHLCWSLDWVFVKSADLSLGFGAVGSGSDEECVENRRQDEISELCEWW